VHDELISAVEDDVVAVARIECHQGVTTTNCLGPSGEMISKFKLRVVGDGVEIVVAVDQASQTLLDDVEERVERRECRVLGIGHDLLLGWLGVFISAPAKSTPTGIELCPREFVFCPYRSPRGKGLRLIERRYCHVNPFRTDFVLDKQRCATTRGERA
jgi:hypothetical protein